MVVSGTRSPAPSRGAPRCQVWWAAPDTVAPADAALLDPAERVRLDGFRSPRRRAGFLGAAVLLRRLVADQTGVAPQEVAVDRTCARCGEPHGRPRLPGLDLYASITHSGDLVGVALTGAGPVGLDVERVVHRDLDRVRGRVLQAGEAAASLVDFYRYWTRKESVVKATGAGLTVPLRRVRVSRPDRPPRLLSYPGVPGLTAALADLRPGAGYVAAVTVLGVRGCPVAERWWLPAGSVPSRRRRA